MIEVAGLRKEYKNKVVIRDVNLYVKKGEIVGLLGPNGAGKTTIFYMITGLLFPTKGQIFLNSVPVTHDPMYIRARKGMSYLPQESSIFRKLTVKENLMAILELLPTTASERNEKVSQLLREFNISHLADQKAFTLSGGERRRVEIARALVTSPSFILLDEPFAGIDPISVADIQNIIYHLKNREIGILITDHNVQETLAITDRAYIINAGEILAAGPPAEIINSPKARAVYLGEKFQWNENKRMNQEVTISSKLE
ncbi:MAG: LPS export ABC transporter ATP-binding protein [Nitrospirae bacterium]|nr:LPS export ABC transporter ATP-binding protein [Nitrospirota bacterium]